MNIHENKELIHSFTIDEKVKIDVYSISFISSDGKNNGYIMQGTEEWYAIRNKYITSTEVATILGLNRHISYNSLLLKKITNHREKQTKQMLEGLIMEPFATNILRYYPIDETTTDITLTHNTYNNFINKNIINDVYEDKKTYMITIKDIDGFIEVPILCSPDCYILKNDKKYPVDIKRTGKYTYESQINSGFYSTYVWQSIMQQLRYNSEYGYLFFNIFTNDGLEFKHEKIEIENYKPFIKEILINGNRFYEDLNRYKNIPVAEILKILDLKDSIDYNIVKEQLEAIPKEGEIKIDINNEKEYKPILDCFIYSQQENEIENINNIYNIIEWYVHMNETKIKYEKTIETFKNNIKIKFPDCKKINIVEGDNRLATITTKPFKIYIN